MKLERIRWGYIFFGIGLLLILKSCHQRQSGYYLADEDISVYTDTLREQIWYADGGEGVSDQYQIQLSYSTSKFILVERGCDIVHRNKNKSGQINSLKPGDIVSVYYKTEQYASLYHGLNTTPIYGLEGNGISILTPDEVRNADKRDFRNWNLAGWIFLVFGVVAHFLRKNRD